MSNLFDEVTVSRDAAELLVFQEPEQIHSSSGFPPYNSPQQANPNNDPDPNIEDPNVSVFSIPYFKKFFNVNTDDVVKRVKYSLLPNMSVNYFEEYIKAKPDLYGPVWICVTLAFTIAIGSNLLDYISSPESTTPWKYEFHVITKASLIVFVYAWIIPILLWSLFKWYLASQMFVSAMELICVYGYCLVSFVPLSLLWIIYLPYIQWVLLLLAASSSGFILVSSIQPMLNTKNYALMGGVMVLHVFFSIVIFLSFFHKKS